ncbi:MAG: Gx transporter family protein [Spirochaetota bacterium]
MPRQDRAITRAIKGSGEQQRVFFIAFLATLSIFLSIAEHAVPKPFPFLRLGLANAVTLYAFTVMRPREVFLVVLSRVVIASLMIGTFLSIAFVLSFSGAVSSFFVMLAVYNYFKKIFSLVGVSIFGAVTSNVVQLWVVNNLFVQTSLSYYFLPFLLLLGLGGGIVSGLFGEFLARNI